MSDAKLDFSTVLAASMHDMKNSLCMLLQTVDKIADQFEEDSESNTDVAQIHYEISRLNSNLLQLLALYRENSDQLPMNIEEHYFDELVEELYAKNETYMVNRGIQFNIDVQPDTPWFYDYDLVSNLLNDIVINALRYTKSCIQIRATVEDNKLVFYVEDDGQGYPEAMLKQDFSGVNKLDLNLGRTGLGLYFANLIAQAHQSKGEQGNIALSNSSELGGSQFKLVLP